MRNVLQLTICIGGWLLLNGCAENKYPKEIKGYQPIYAQTTELKTISSESPKPTTNAGKIYSYANYVYQIDNGTGIHVIDAHDPKNPVKVAFLKITGCAEMSIQNNMLYTNNMDDLVSINIADLNNIQVVSRIQKVFPVQSNAVPPVTGVYFECVDESQGTVIGWKEELLLNPKCKN